MPETTPPLRNSIKIHSRIQKQADQLGLKISNYEGFTRGGWKTGDKSPNPSGMWVFTIEAKYPTKTTDHEPAYITEENIDQAISEMCKWAKYLFS